MIPGQGRPPKHDQLPRGAELREVTLGLNPAEWKIPLTVLWQEITEHTARGLVVSIDGEPCEPFRVEITAEPEVSAVRLAGAHVSPSSMGPAPRLTDHRET